MLRTIAEIVPCPGMVQIFVPDSIKMSSVQRSLYQITFYLIWYRDDKILYQVWESISRRRANSIHWIMRTNVCFVGFIKWSDFLLRIGASAKKTLDKFSRFFISKFSVSISPPPPKFSGNFYPEFHMNKFLSKLLRPDIFCWILHTLDETCKFLHKLV